MVSLSLCLLIPNIRNKLSFFFFNLCEEAHALLLVLTPLISIFGCISTALRYNNINLSIESWNLASTTHFDDILAYSNH